MPTKKIFVIALSAVLLTAFALSIYALSPVIKEMNLFQKANNEGLDISQVDEAGDFKYCIIDNATRVDLSASSESIVTEKFTDEKTDIYNKMLNSIDFLNKVNATAKTNMLGVSESILEYNINIDSGLSYQSVKENDIIVSETYSDATVEMVEVNNIAKSYTNNYLPVYTREDTPYISLNKRIVVGDDGIPCYYYRRNITNCPLASYCLVPQEITFSYLKDFDNWSIEDASAEYAGRSCTVIYGTPSSYIAIKHKIDSFKMVVDKETGVLLSFEGYLNNEIIRYMYITEINDGNKSTVKQFDANEYTGYKQIAR